MSAALYDDKNKNELDNMILEEMEAGTQKGRHAVLLRILRYFQKWDSELPALISNQDDIKKALEDNDNSNETRDTRIIALEKFILLHQRDFEQGCPMCNNTKKLISIEDAVKKHIDYWKITAFVAGSAFVMVLGVLAKLTWAVK